MDEENAREILRDAIDEHGLFDGYNFIRWPSGFERNGSSDLVDLDGSFESDELKAIAWWMENRKPSTP